MLRRDDESVLRVVLNPKEKARTTEDLEEARARDREDWYEEGGCSESSKVERRSARNCRRNGVNPAISAKETIPDKN